MDKTQAAVLPPTPVLRWRPEYVNLLRRQYEALDRWSAETGVPITALIRKAIDEALLRRGFDGKPAIVEAP